MKVASGSIKWPEKPSESITRSSNVHLSFRVSTLKAWGASLPLSRSYIQYIHIYIPKASHSRSISFAHWGRIAWIRSQLWRPIESLRTSLSLIRESRRIFSENRVPLFANYAPITACARSIVELWIIARASLISFYFFRARASDDPSGINQKAPWRSVYTLGEQIITVIFKSRWRHVYTYSTIPFLDFSLSLLFIHSHALSFALCTRPKVISWDTRELV